MVNGVLAAWAGARAATPNPVPGPDARTAAQTELQRVEYHRDEPSLLTRVLRWLSHRLDSLFTGGAGSHVLLLLIVVLLVIVVVVAARNTRQARNLRARGGDQFDPLAPQSRIDHRGLATRFEAQGQLAEALREWLRAAIASIEQRGVLPARPGRTGAATAREARAVLPAVAADLDAATRAFDEVWFGGRPALDVDVAAARRAADGAASARIVHASVAPGGLAVPW